MSDRLLTRTDDGAVATLTLNNPAALNALSDRLLKALQDAFDALAVDRSIRVIILKGAGKAFCAGHDLKEMTAGRTNEDGGAAYFQTLFETCSTMMLSIRALPQPVIAQVHGIATAAGCQLVASCDLAVASDDARFGVNGVNIGLFCSTPMVALSRNISRKKLFEMLTTGAFISAQEAATLGLVNQVVPPENLDAAAQQMAAAIASKLGSAVRIGKRAFYEQLEMGMADAYAHAGDVMAQNMMDQDTAEGIAAFIEKRPAHWQQE